MGSRCDVWGGCAGTNKRKEKIEPFSFFIFFFFVFFFLFVFFVFSFVFFSLVFLLLRSLSSFSFSRLLLLLLLLFLFLFLSFFTPSSLLLLLQHGRLHLCKAIPALLVGLAQVLHHGVGGEKGDEEQGADRDVAVPGARVEPGVFVRGADPVARRREKGWMRWRGGWHVIVVDRGGQRCPTRPPSFPHSLTPSQLTQSGHMRRVRRRPSTSRCSCCQSRAHPPRA